MWEPENTRTKKVKDCTNNFRVGQKPPSIYERVEKTQESGDPRVDLLRILVSTKIIPFHQNTNSLFTLKEKEKEEGV